MSACSGLKKTVSAAQKSPVAEVVRVARPEMAALKPLPPIFVPEFEFFRSRPGAWGPGRRMGGLWAYDPAETIKIDGVAVSTSGAIVLLQGRKASSPVSEIVRLDFGGRMISSVTIAGLFKALDCGSLGGRETLVLQSGSESVVTDGQGRPAWARQSAQAGFADLAGDSRGELLSVSSAVTAVEAFAADGRRLWRAGGMGNIFSLAAGRTQASGPMSVAVFASSGIAILRHDGRKVAEFQDATMPERGKFLRIDGRGGVLLAHLGSRLLSARETLRISRLEGRARKIVAEAQVGPVNVISMTAGDFNGDGRKEIALGTDNGWVLIYNERAVWLGEKHHFGSIYYLSAGELNNDGRDELLVGVGGESSHIYAYGVR